ncbi:hypothetical protein [Pseudoalteromonas luteoviolacea]|uniref:Uncharacterized protein n=1 Tax=Pseudoalteromonas luteoviolacea DSM 6061 TaxID=1365250 RepID=A0A166W4M6_9GAMM|nr:hypothetical protein [Pseudoalteromonas luteoviolacea]KZN35403.1 hypothetical protein N475_18850 [Pseudoalteromonas luteoviolacea DSM 6061]KZN53525.1 hypothetical protein N474_20925 [Pseudoalteromonas luteoviolacea CPMOR-2]MBE0387650.1 hypothetical protein [Pseudoalteromonas luteoviolacea DSM 6061]TQF72431.1 hypothetical protein FLM44_15860 [Pseudoalteromonas luteoviolacea]
MDNLNSAPDAAESAVQSAQQSIAQSTALALSDATDNLRNLNTLSTTAIGVALSQYIETGDDKFSKIIEDAQSIVSRGADNFSAVGEKIATVLHENQEE